MRPGEGEVLSYTVKINAFEGPFDLLLQLVSRQKLDVGAIPIAQITDQYLDYISQAGDLDLDIASDFIYVASTLLELKSSSLLPQDEVTVGDDLAELSTDTTRDILVARLIAYKQYKNIAVMLSSRYDSTSRMHPRHAGLPDRFANLMPDYLENVSLQGLAVICADLAGRREAFLLEAEHVASPPISLEKHAKLVVRKVRAIGRTTFSELCGNTNDPTIIVVTFLAVLELYKRGEITMNQAETFGTLVIESLGNPPAAATSDDDMEEGL